MLYIEQYLVILVFLCYSCFANNRAIQRGVSVAKVRLMEDKEHDLIGNTVPQKTRIQVLEECIAERMAELQELECAIAVVKSTIALHLQLLATEKANQGLSSDAEIQSPFSSTNHRSPMEMLRPPYKGMKLAEIITIVLKESSSPLTTTELSHIIYDTHSDEELYRARNSLSAELRTGAKSNPPRWKKLGRYAYAAF
jgi:hypothetical protein